MINTKRMLLAYVVTLIVVNIYDFLVYGLLLSPINSAHPELLRPQAELPQLRMFLAGALGWALITVFYALFARGRASQLSTGIVFGVLLGLIAGWIPQAYLKMLMVNWPFYLSWAPAGFGEFFVGSIVLSLIYRE